GRPCETRVRPVMSVSIVKRICKSSRSTAQQPPGAALAPHNAGCHRQQARGRTPLSESEAPRRSLRCGVLVSPLRQGGVLLLLRELEMFLAEKPEPRPL